MSNSQYGPPRTYQANDDRPVTMAQFQWFMEGMRHARLATVFGVLGVMSFGVVFGPLALSQAKKAEAFGVPAVEGRVLGWIGIGLFVLSVLFFVLYMVVIFNIVGSLPHKAGTGV